MKKPIAMRFNFTPVKPPFRAFVFLFAFIITTTTSFSQILFSSSFEGTNPFAGATNNQSCCSHSVTASTEHPHDGLKSYRAEVKTDDPAVSSGYRAELTFPNIPDQGDMWYGWSMYFEANNAAMNDWTGCCGHVLQWHPESSGGGAVLDLRADGGKFDICVNPTGSSSTTHQPGTLKDIVPGRWYDVVMHVNWSGGADGLLEVWIDGALYFTRQVSWGIGRYFKFGMNRWNMSNTWVVFYDNLKIGRNVTYNDVAPVPSTTPANQSPTANAGNNITVTLPNNAQLSGSGQDADGSIAGYTWSYVSGPTGYSITTPALQATTVTGLAAGTYVFRLTVRDNLGATGTDDVQVIVNPATPPPNQPPTARAGNDITITLPATATLNGNASTDPDGTIRSYAWSYVNGPANSNLLTPGLVSTIVNSLIAGTYTFQLTVTDDDGATDTDDIQVIVNPLVPPPNQPPVARAGNDITITLPDSDVDLNGSASTDADGTINGWTWSWVSGPTTYSITTPSLSATTVTGLVAGTYVFRLTVRDDDNATSSDNITVVVNPATPPPPPPNQPPVARAGTDIEITLPNSQVSLNGTTSTDADGTINGWSWTWVSGPTTYSITTPSSNTTTVTGLVAGTYVFRLTVRDDDNATSSDNITVKVNPEPAPPPPANNEGPLANAGNEIIVTLPVNRATLYGTGSTDPDGLITTYAWTQLSGPSQATISNPGSPTLQVTDLMIGEYVFRLKVTDNGGASATATVKVIVRNKNGEDLYCNIYPNPTGSILNVQYLGNGVGKARIVMYDAHNHYVLGETVPKNQVLLSKVLDISKFRSGIYFLEITIPGSKKIIKKIIKL